MKYALVALFALSTLAFSAEPNPLDTQDRVKGLITKLGDDDPKVRDEASRELRKVGKDAQAALAEAKKSDDAEVAARAEAIAKLIEQDSQPKTKPAGGPGNSRVLINPGGFGGGLVQGGVSVSVSTTSDGKGTTRKVQVNEPGRKVRITENAEGIDLAVTEPDKDGKEQTKEYKAKDAESLKKENPEAAAVYEKYAKGGVVQVQVQAGNIGVGNLQGLEALPEADRERMQKMLERALKQQERVQKLMEEMQKEMLLEEEN